jgi:carbamoyl-phosphate synthase small subunit
VRREGDGRVEITCQNHGFAVAPGSFQTTAASITHTNLNDQTIEGIAVDGLAFSVQYHPEAAPGPRDARYLFERFSELMTGFAAPAGGGRSELW